MTNLKILAIGNSFSDDCVKYLPDIARAQGADGWIVANLYIGGCSLETHLENARGNIKAYEYRKNMDGIWNNTPKTSLSDGLSDEKWDVITMQQASGDSGIAETYAPLRELFGYVSRGRRGVRFLWNMTWAYQSDSAHPRFIDYRNDREAMYRAIVRAVRREIAEGDSPFDGIIPTGTAVENARLGSLGDTLTRDGYHLSDPIGRYLAALTWFRALTGENARNALTEELEAVHGEFCDCVSRAFAKPWCAASGIGRQMEQRKKQSAEKRST